VLVGRIRLGRESPPLSESKRSSVSSQPSLSLFLALLSTKERLRQRVGRYRRTGLTPHRSERLKFCFVLISVNCSFMSHLSFTAPMPFLHCLEGFLGGGDFCNADVKMEVHYCKGTVALPAPRQSHLYSRASAVDAGLQLLLVWGHLGALVIQG